MKPLREKRGNISRVIPDGMAQRILDRIMGDCIECPDCGAMTFWTGNNKNAMGKAIVEIDRIRYAVRRAIYQIKHGVGNIGANQCIVTTCTERCLNHEHLKSVSKGGVVRRAVQQGNLHGVLHRAAITQSRRERGDAKLNMEKAREIRASNMTPTQLEKELGVSRQTISQIRSGRTWVETSNPFAGLGARGTKA